MSLKQYKQSRRIGKRLSEEIPMMYDFESNILVILRTLGIAQGRNIVLENEEEINFLIDFYLHELLLDGQTVLERYREEQPKLKQEEIAYLDAAKCSYTSLFKVIDLMPAENSVLVQDLLNTSAPELSVININFSQTGRPGCVMFSRLLPHETFNAFSGMFAIFGEGGDRALLKRYKVMKKRVKSERESVQRFVACFKLNRVLGQQVLTV